jgi:hypothetical protein
MISSSVGCRILFPTPLLDEAAGAVNLCRDFNVGHHVVSSFSGGSLRSSARYLEMYLKPLRPPIVRRQFSHRHHPLPCCSDHRPGTIGTARMDFSRSNTPKWCRRAVPPEGHALHRTGPTMRGRTPSSAGLPIRPCTPLEFRASSRSSRGCFGRINVRSFVSSPLIVLGKRLKLIRNVLVGHCLGSAEQSLSCF